MSTLEVYLTNHAVQRFIERVRPGLGWPLALAQLNALVAGAEVALDPPDWWCGVETHAGALYLHAGDLVLPLVPGQRPSQYVATTCVARGNLTVSERRYRNRCKRERRQTRHLARAGVC